MTWKMDIDNLIAESNYTNFTGAMFSFTDLPSKWGWWLKQIVTPLIVVIGILGNTLSFVVMKSRMWRHKSYSHFLCALAVFDSLTLINREVLLVHHLRVYAGDSGLYTRFSDVACSIYNFYEHMCYLMSSWLIVCMAIERVVAVYYPIRKAFLCTQMGAVTVIFALVVLLAYTQIFRFFMVGKVETVCAALSVHLQIYTALHVYLYQFVLIFILPVALVLVCNILVLGRIYRVRRLRNCEESVLPRARNVISHRHKTTLMLLTISFIYVITLLPSVIVSIVAYATIATATTRNAAYLLVQLSPYKDLFELVSDINYGCNFFIYILSGKLFRFELRKMFSWDRSTGITTTKARDDVGLF